MRFELSLLILLVASVVGLFVVQAIVIRIARRAGYDAGAPQALVVLTELAWNVPVVAAAWLLVFQDLHGLDLIAGLLFVLLVYNCCGFGYFCLLNVTETSLHVNILMQLRVQGGMTQDQLIARYSVKQMLAARIERMTSLGHLENRDGRYYLRKNTVLQIERVYDLWRRILALPLSPEE